MLIYNLNKNCNTHFCRPSWGGGDDNFVYLYGSIHPPPLPKIARYASVNPLYLALLTFVHIVPSVQYSYLVIVQSPVGLVRTQQIADGPNNKLLSFLIGIYLASDVDPHPVGSGCIWVRGSGSRGIKSLIKKLNQQKKRNFAGNFIFQV